MDFWLHAKEELDRGRPLVLLYVVQSLGSSPGRQGFKMLVGESGFLHGSIGGGIMEHKFVEWCRAGLLSKSFRPFLQRQIHRSDTGKEQSGMICSGEQTIAFCKLEAADLPVIAQIAGCIREGQPGMLILNQEGLLFSEAAGAVDILTFSMESHTQWVLTVRLNSAPRLFIAGAGHVSLALARLASRVGFSVEVFDDRAGLNTVPEPEVARFTCLPDYRQIAAHLPEGDQSYVVLMSFGYRTDKLVLQQLIGRRYRYLGMMGSATKVATLFRELADEGADPEALRRVHAPVGLPIHSRTPEEIAVSVVAELIRVKNSSGEK